MTVQTNNPSESPRAIVGFLSTLDACFIEAVLLQMHATEPTAAPMYESEILARTRLTPAQCRALACTLRDVPSHVVSRALNLVRMCAGAAHSEIAERVRYVEPDAPGLAWAERLVAVERPRPLMEPDQWEKMVAFYQEHCSYLAEICTTAARSGGITMTAFGGVLRG
jgi:hypothetical protein